MSDFNTIKHDAQSANPTQPILHEIGQLKPPSIEGIGGWLIIPVIYLLFAILITIKQFIVEFSPLFNHSNWEEFSNTFGPLWESFFIVALIFKFIIFTLCIISLILLFKKSSLFPTFYIILLIASPAFVIINLVRGYQIPAFQEHVIPDILNNLGGSLLVAAIGIPYFLMSDRVKNTFHRHIA